jgi:hexosaminidase
VNGKLQERLEGRKKRVYNPKYDRLESMPIQETLVFPLKQIGSPINGFKGQIKHVIVKQE